MLRSVFILIKSRSCFSQSESNDKSEKDESEQPPQSSIEPSVAIRKQVPSADIRSNRKSMFEQPTTQANTHVNERVNTFLLK
jgi:hypothetical protein